MKRLGWGIEHPDVAPLLAGLTPAAAPDDQSWGQAGRFTITPYLTPDALPPDEVVGSIRCIVRVGDGLLLVRDPSPSILPGGRREAGETWVQTLVRELHEETGWRVDEATIEQVGLLHIRSHDPRPDDHAYPSPDSVMVVMVADGLACEADGRVDVEGQVLASGPAGRVEVLAALAADPVESAFALHVLGPVVAPP